MDGFTDAKISNIRRELGDLDLFGISKTMS